MPVQMRIFVLPGGARCLRMETSGHFSAEDADVVVRATNPGGEYHRLPQLVQTHKQLSISSEARKVFAARGELGEAEPWVAVVVTNPVVRVTTNFLARVGGSRKTRLFAAEAEALAWLDQHAPKPAGA